VKAAAFPKLLVGAAYRLLLLLLLLLLPLLGGNCCCWALLRLDRLPAAAAPHTAVPCWEWCCWASTCCCCCALLLLLLPSLFSGGAGITTYKELCSLANELGQPDLIYRCG
jgi:hypothetical protein